MTCPVCHRDWRDVDRHLAFAHGETVVLTLDPPAHPTPEPEPVWVGVAYSLLAFAALALVVGP